MRHKLFLLVLCIAFVTEWIAVSASTSPPIKDLRLNVIPPSIHQGYTKHLAINCTFDHSHDPHFGTLVQLVFSKETGTSGVFTDVGSISPYVPNQVKVKDSLGGDVKGSFSANGVSFISYEWDDPTFDLEGRYRCEALGMDQHGHPQTSSDTANIEEKMVNLSMAFDKINELKVKLYKCQQEQSNATIMIDHCLHVKNNLTIATDELKQCRNLTLKAADCEHDKTNMGILINECSIDRNSLTMELLYLQDKKHNLTTSFSMCKADRENMSKSIDICNHDLRDKNMMISQSINETTELNGKLDKCSQDNNNLTTTLNECKNKGNVFKTERDHCRNDTNNLSLLLNECKTRNQDLNTRNNNNLIELEKSKRNLIKANMNSVNFSKVLTDLQQQKQNTDRLMENYRNEIDHLIEALFEKTSNVFNGHSYYLSYPVLKNITHSHNTCKSLGGTLAEINGYYERRFIKYFCRDSGVNKSTAALLGVTYSVNGTWTYYSSGNSVDYYHGRMNQTHGECMYLHWNNVTGIHHSHCYSHDETTRFLCEVPHPI